MKAQREHGSQSSVGNFTPGPWKARKDTAERETIWIESVTHGVLASISNGYGIGENDRANAALIAAAPSMYEALIKAQKALIEGNHSIMHIVPLLDEIKDTIRLAEGR